MKTHRRPSVSPGLGLGKGTQTYVLCISLRKSSSRGPRTHEEQLHEGESTSAEGDRHLHHQPDSLDTCHRAHLSTSGRLLHCTVLSPAQFHPISIQGSQENLLEDSSMCTMPWVCSQHRLFCSGHTLRELPGAGLGQAQLCTLCPSPNPGPQQRLKLITSKAQPSLAPVGLHPRGPYFCSWAGRNRPKHRRERENGVTREIKKRPCWSRPMPS